MPHRWVASDSMCIPQTLALPPRRRCAHQHAAAAQSVALHCDFDALPFANHSLDLVVLPHALELARDPHLTLREVERVLVPEGRVVIIGFNPASLWGLRQRAGPHAAAPRAGPPQRLVPAARRRIHRLLAAARLAAPAQLRGRGRALRLLPPAAQRRSAGSTASPGSSASATAGGRCSVRCTSWSPSSACAACAWSAWRAQRARQGAGRTGRGQPAATNADSAKPIAAMSATADRGGDLHRRRLQGQPRPRRLGRLAADRRAREGALGGEALTTNNRMELTAVIEALASLKRPLRRDRSTPTASTCATASRVDPRLEAARLEDRRQEAGEERRPVAAPGHAGRSSTQVQWRWVKGHAGDPGNERADCTGQPGRDCRVEHLTRGCRRRARATDVTVRRCAERMALKKIAHRRWPWSASALLAAAAWWYQSDRAGVGGVPTRAPRPPARAPRRPARRAGAARGRPGAGRSGQGRGA